MTRPFFRLRWTLLLGVLVPSLLIAYLLNGKEIRQVQPEPQEAHETAGPAGWWSTQAQAAEQAGLQDVAEDYHARVAGYEKAMKLLAQADAFPPADMGHVPSVPASLYERRLLPAGDQPASGMPPAKHEPVSGVYLGMLGADKRVGYDVTKIEGVYGKRHTLYLSYVGWGKVQVDTNSYFPLRNAERIKGLGGAIQIGWEPRYGLEAVVDDEYVRGFAREAKAAGLPVFLRYASEMNGAWVPWHGSPQLYIEKFRLIHDIMEQEAPNVAMVWSPNFLPFDNIHDYYPGDDYVDWIGLSLYATPMTDGKPDLGHNVIEYLTPFYARYSHKPIMISEGAVAHTVLATNQTYWKWAEGQLAYMYGLLPRLFPQVKAMTYFNFSRAQAQRSGMEYVYDLGENPYTDALYKRLIQSDTYVSRIGQQQDASTYEYVPIQAGSLPQSDQELLVYMPTLPDGTWPFAVGIVQGTRLMGLSFEMPWLIQVRPSASASEQPWYVVAYNERMEPVSISPIQ
ncbi:glycoside hydrolase family 26 protein [Paenibacillus sp. y28]|uniref:glycoside hydrolase family 26 protein n=1 Tax=Paenibacillus sp. y28 TaxID=3129110 RepID=UPI00301AE095